MIKKQEKKIAIFTSADLVAVLICNHLIPQIINLGLIPIIINTGRTHNKKSKHAPPRDIEFYVNQITEEHLLPYLDRKTPVVAKNFSYKMLTKRYNADCIFIKNINNINELKEKDMQETIGGISIRQYQIFDKTTIDTWNVKRFLWNLHGGLLPKYKGLLCGYQAIMNGEKNYGWTLHEINEGIDTGRIISTCQKPLDPQKPVLDTYLDMIEPSVAMIINALQKQLNGTIEEIKQPNIGGKYYSYPTALEMEAYKKAGIRYVHSPKTYVDKIVSLFSNPDTPHGQGLKTELINAITEHFRTERTAFTPAEKTTRSA